MGYPSMTLNHVHEHKKIHIKQNISTFIADLHLKITVRPAIRLFTRQLITKETSL